LFQTALLHFTINSRPRLTSALEVLDHYCAKSTYLLNQGRNQKFILVFSPSLPFPLPSAASKWPQLRETRSPKSLRATIPAKVFECAATGHVSWALNTPQMRLRLTFVYQAHRVKVTVTGAKSLCIPFARGLPSTERQSRFFTALHVMQTRYSDENSVCPSVCPSICLSVTRVICDKTEERPVQIFIPYERTFILVF